MGMFDVRCAVSGLPTSWTRNADEQTLCTTSMFFVEQQDDGSWLPFTPPVVGTYDNYGRIDVPEELRDENSRFVGKRLDALRDTGALVVVNAAYFAKRDLETDLFLDGTRKRRPRIQTWLSTPESPTNPPTMTHEGRAVRHCLFIETAAQAVLTSMSLRARDEAELALREAGPEVFADWLEEKGRSALAKFVRAVEARGLFGAFGEAPHGDVAGFRVLLEWMIESPGGLTPMFNDYHEDDEAEVALAAARRDAVLEQLVEQRLPEEVAKWRAEGKLLREAVAQVAGRPYKASERFEIDDVVQHPTFGIGVVEELKAPNKVIIKFGVERRTLIHRR